MHEGDTHRGINEGGGEEGECDDDSLGGIQGRRVPKKSVLMIT